MTYISVDFLPPWLNTDLILGIDPIIGRDEEIRRVIQILTRRTKNNPILLGEPGVGKVPFFSPQTHFVTFSSSIS